MSTRGTAGPDDELTEIKRLAAIKLEADLHAYLDTLTIAGLSEEEAAALALSTLQTILTQAPQRPRSPRRARGA